MDKHSWERTRSVLPRDDRLCLRETSKFHAECEWFGARLNNCAVAVGTCTPSTVLGRRNDAFIRFGWNAEAMESNAYSKAVDGNDDFANTEVHSDSFRVE